MHTFNIWTEAGTRDTLNGYWFRNFVDSVSELRGWSDSDKFMAPTGILSVLPVGTFGRSRRSFHRHWMLRNESDTVRLSVLLVAEPLSSF
jgi:uncharacterized protein YggL (DUF469 family)